jgi:3-hydroxyacyl-CoA dehydrogenase
MRPIGVAGAGTMGAGIAALAAGAGIPTLLYDPDPAALDRAPEGPERTGELEALAPCGLVIEAAPEDLEVKRALFARLAAIAGEDCVLATNTSSLSVTALAAGLPHPERVVGMHFFNPPQKMRLLEVVAGDASGEAALAAARAAGEAMGKHVIDAADGPGFLVNRCNRPFSLEALRIVQERLATPEQVDRICRMAGGFRMGPFELMDLVGLDVGFAVARSFHEQSFGEPRWRPSPLVARLVAAGRLGRKSGRGWYEYPPGRPADPEPPAGVADADALRAAGVDGIHLVPPAGRLVEVTTDEAERLVTAQGVHAERVGGPVLGRIVAQLINEACFALGEGVGSAADIDAGMVLGLNHPRGPLEWADLIGPAAVLDQLDGLRRDYGEERYRAAPALRRAVSARTTLAA